MNRVALAALLWLTLVTSASAQSVTFQEYAGSASTAANTVTRTFTFASGNAAIVGVMTTDKTASLTGCADGGTHTYAQVLGPLDSIGNARLWALTAYNTSTASVTITCTFSATVADAAMVVAEYSKSSGTWATDGTSSKTDNASATTILWNAVTTTHADAVVIGIAAYAATRATTATGTGFTLRSTGTIRMALIDNITTATGTYTPEGTVPSAVNSVTATVAVRTGTAAATVCRGALMGVGC